MLMKFKLKNNKTIDKYQQHAFLLLFIFSDPRAKLFDLSGRSYFAETYLANSLKTSSTFVPSLADVNMNRIFFYFPHALIFSSGIEFPKSDLFPTKNMIALSAFERQRSYQDFTTLSKLSGLT